MAEPTAVRPLLGLLLRTKGIALANRVREAARTAPLRLGAGTLLIAVVWFGLYGLFLAIFFQFKRTPLEATVAIPMVFNFFFMAMLVMLTFSNAIVSYGALFTRSESVYLRAAPLAPLDFVTLRYLESLLFSSWSLVVLGLPLMLALARVERAEEPVFYLLFIGFFLAFIPIPGALGLLLGWSAARFFPRRALRFASALLVIGGTVLMLWGMRSLPVRTTEVEQWLRTFLSRMQFIEAPFWPNYWVASGIDHALHDQWHHAMGYLGVTIANAWFLSWLLVRFVARHLERAWDRASSRSRGRGRLVPAAAAPTEWLFFYLSKPLRLVAAKDLRTFLRDPLQWAQLVILFGLMILYLTNMPTLRFQFNDPRWIQIIPFLNLCAVSLILATFTCRFVFPLVSLEGHQLWLIGLLPMPRGRILLAKFAFAMTVTVIAGAGAMLWGAVMLELPPAWTALHVVVTLAVCFGLCGLAVGLGARMPMFGQTNTARIANGLGGTANLLASLALIAVILTGVGAASWGPRLAVPGAPPDARATIFCLGATAVGLLAGTVALRIGARHFQRVEV
ncbi:MAG: hypothetical protein D6788_01280 [Planctomycetota bacterium]|nr:MAG: hypothetical protein D6788_01280 [Planctomycetota bacterium]